MDNTSYDKLINRIIDKRYKIETVVGVGGMAYVLRAKDLTTGRDVAIKILSDEFKDDAPSSGLSTNPKPFPCSTMKTS